MNTQQSPTTKQEEHEYIVLTLRRILFRVQLVAIGIVVLKIASVILYAQIAGYDWFWDQFWGPIYIIVFSIEPQQFITMHTVTLVVGFIVAVIGEIVALLHSNRKGRHIWIDVFYAAIMIETIQYIVAIVWEVHDKPTASPVYLWFIIPAILAFSVYYRKHFFHDILQLPEKDNTLQ